MNCYKNLKLHEKNFDHNIDNQLIKTQLNDVNLQIHHPTSHKNDDYIVLML